VTPDRSRELRAAATAATTELEQRHQAREITLPLCRRAIRASALAIRAAHRGDLDDGRDRLRDAAACIAEASAATEHHPGVRDAGYVHDAQKEYAEAALSLAYIAHEAAPSAVDLAVDTPAYLNGMAEAASELRRQVLDRLRDDDTAEAEALFAVMDQVYDLLISVDYPDALTGGLRRSTDALRAVLERTRGDITNAVVLVRFDRSITREHSTSAP
jgi:translin